MLTRNSAGVAHRNDADAREIDQLGGRVDFLATTPDSSTFQVIRAELTGDDTCRAGGLVATSPSPILALCRFLISAGANPDRPLQAFRGDVPCLHVKSIRQGARLRVAPHGVGFQWLPECTGASPARENPSSPFPHTNPEQYP